MWSGLLSSNPPAAPSAELTPWLGVVGGVGKASLLATDLYGRLNESTLEPKRTSSPESPDMAEDGFTIPSSTTCMKKIKFKDPHWGSSICR